MIKIAEPQLPAELAELVDALDSDSSVCKDFRVQVPSSAYLCKVPVLTSRQNPLVKSFRKLHQPKFRKQSQTCLLEGTNLIEAAIAHQYPLQTCCWTERWQAHHSDLCTKIDALDLRTELVSDEVMDAMATTKHPDGVVAIAPWPEVDRLPEKFTGTGLVLESIQDPGNLGTILRSTSAAQGEGLFLSADCVALTNPKVLRASVGSWFRVPTYCPQDLPSALKQYQQKGVQLVATTPTATQSYWTVDYQKPTLILIGNEGAGLSQDLIDLADLEVTIPIDDNTESLNAAIAASIILFEGRRQRLIP